MKEFDLKKFLVENKLTTNSRMLKEDRNLTPFYDSEEEEEQGLSGYERLNAKIDKLDITKQRNAYNLYDFVDRLGANTEDNMIINAIYYTVLDNNANEIITILADTVGDGGEEDPFDGVFTYSDIENALEDLDLSDDLKNQILDDDRIRHLELG